MAQLTKELVVASLIPELTSQNWQQLLDVVKNIKISKETIGTAYSDLLKVRNICLRLRERQDEEDAEDAARIKARKEGYDSIVKPMEEILKQAEPEFIRYNTEIRKEEAEIIAAIEKKNEVRERHVEFVNEISKLISGALNNSELARVQMLIGSEKARTSFYGDYYPVIEETCNSMLMLVDDRKAMIKENASIEKLLQKALAAGDMPKATQLKEQIELNESVIKENLQLLIEEAYAKVASVALLNTDFASAAVKPRLHRWSWRVDDIELLYKKQPNLVEKQPNKKAIGVFMKQQEDTGELNEIDDNLFNGLVIFRKQFFVSL